MAPWFSIILPVYNVQDYLDRCVKSVQNQSFQDFEMILVDDGSTDGSGGLCDTLARQYDNISVLHKPNGGLASARNAGLAAAKGKYIWWVDSDDWIESGALETLYRVTADREPELVKFNYNRVEQQTVAVHTNAAPGSYTEEKIEQLRDLAFRSAGKYVLSACTHIYSRQFLEKNGLQFVSERLVGSEDYLFNLQVLLYLKQAQVITEVFYNYEQRMGSLTQKYKKDLPQAYTQLYHRLRESCDRAGVLQQYEGKICRLFVWHLLHSTCISNEYYVSPQHSIEQGRKNIRRFLRNKECRNAILRCDKTGMTSHQKLQLAAMLFSFEPMFYWLWRRNKR